MVNTILAFLHSVITATLDVGVLALLIPIIAIMGAFGNKALKQILQHQQTLATIKAERVQQKSGAGSAEIETLREELKSLRETSTQHALSLQHLVDTLDRRVAFLEARGRSMTPSQESDRVQRVGRIDDSAR